MILLWALKHHQTGLAILSALITFFFIRPLTTDGMAVEDREVCITFGLQGYLTNHFSCRQFREYLEANGYDTSTMGLMDTSVESSVEEDVKDEKA